MAPREQLRAGGVEVIQGPESHENGKFAWIMTPTKTRSSSRSRRSGTTRTKVPDQRGGGASTMKYWWGSNLGSATTRRLAFAASARKSSRAMR